MPLDIYAAMMRAVRRADASLRALARISLFGIIPRRRNADYRSRLGSSAVNFFQADSYFSPLYFQASRAAFSWASRPFLSIFFASLRFRYMPFMTYYMQAIASCLQNRRRALYLLRRP